MREHASKRRLQLLPLDPRGEEPLQELAGQLPRLLAGKEPPQFVARRVHLRGGLALRPVCAAEAGQRIGDIPQQPAPLGQHNLRHFGVKQRGDAIGRSEGTPGMPGSQPP